jgi:hypothetical protein
MTAPSFAQSFILHSAFHLSFLQKIFLEETQNRKKEEECFLKPRVLAAKAEKHFYQPSELSPFAK